MPAACNLYLSGEWNDYPHVLSRHVPERETIRPVLTLGTSASTTCSSHLTPAAERIISRTYPTGALRPLNLVLEVADPRENHGNIVLIGRVDDFGIPHGAAGLDNGSDSIACSGEQTVREREKCVRSH
jgi:hypothetical protein